MTYTKIQEISTYIQILKYLKSGYLLFFSAHRVFRHLGTDVTNVFNSRKTLRLKPGD